MPSIRLPIQTAIGAGARLGESLDVQSPGWAKNREEARPDSSLSSLIDLMLRLIPSTVSASALSVSSTMLWPVMGHSYRVCSGPREADALLDSGMAWQPCKGVTCLSSWIASGTMCRLDVCGRGLDFAADTTGTEDVGWAWSGR
eukprot:scaffold145611_cov47-Prasinocladus_malaysianus.AAC.1